MKSKNFWGISEDTQDNLKYTDNIHIIMEEQCKYLEEYSKGKVFAIFDEIENDGPMFRTLVNLPDTLKNISSITGLQEIVGEISTKDLIDANVLYFNKRYGFEICTNKYRFRLFEIRMTPLYPVEIIVDEGICYNIGKTLARISISLEKSNHFRINDEETFCNVLQNILQDKKVHYIIHELQKRAECENKKNEYRLKKIVVCEGQTDEVILQAIARKLGKTITTVVANGKNNIPAIYKAVKEMNVEADVLIVADSDGEEIETKQMITEKIGDDGYELAIINDCIEDWFIPEVKDYGKLKLIQSIDAIIEETNLNELRNKHKSFVKVEEFLQK